MKKKNDVSLEVIKEIKPLATQAETLEITDNDSLREATSILSRLNKFNDDIEAEKEKVTKPLNQALKAERARWKPAETYYKTAIEAIRSKMVEYQTRITNERKENEEKIVSRIKEGRGNLSLEKAVEKIDALPIVDKDISTEDGAIQFREKKELKVVDISLIPEIYWRIDEDMILTDLKNGINVPGAEIEIKMIPVNFR